MKHLTFLGTCSMTCTMCTHSAYGISYVHNIILVTLRVYTHDVPLMFKGMKHVKLTNQKILCCTKIKMESHDHKTCLFKSYALPFRAVYNI